MLTLPSTGLSRTRYRRYQNELNDHNENKNKNSTMKKNHILSLHMRELSLHDHYGEKKCLNRGTALDLTNLTLLNLVIV